MRQLFTSNVSLKLFSLVLGLVIFLAVRTEQEVTTTVAMRLVLREPQGLINTSDVPPEVTIRLAGTSGRIRALAPNDLGQVQLDLSSFHKGMSVVRIREEQLGIPPDLEVVSISPSAINVRLEPREKKKLPVKVTLQGEVAKGYAVDSIEVDPAEVEIEGPRRELGEVKFIRTAPVDVTNAIADVTASVVFDLPGPHTRINGPGRSEIEVKVAPERGERVVRLEVAGVPGMRQAVAVRARLRGPKLVLDEIDESTLAARAVISPQQKPTEPLPVAIDNLPAGVEVLDPLPTVTRTPPPPVRRR